MHPGHSGPVVRMVLSAAVLLAPAVFALFATRGRLVRGVLAALLGLGATATGLCVAVPHTILAGPGGSDYTGIASTLAGIALVVLAFRIGLHGRRRRLAVPVAVIATFVVAQWLVAPAINAGLVTTAPRPAVASARTLGLARARDVTFPASDGVRLSGWFVPGRTGATVILLHGSHGTRADTTRYLRLLNGAGFTVLAYDARGHGRSEGQTNALGWRGSDDLAGAVRFLARQPRVDPGRIAALGLSMGAEEALRASASGVPLAAVIADGAGASTLGDSELVHHALAPVFESVTWLTMRATALISGESEPPPLKRIVAHIHVPVLLIASGAPNERATDAAYRNRIGRGATLWYVPDSAHTLAFTTHPREYAARILSFLTAALHGARHS